MMMNSPFSNPAMQMLDAMRRGQNPRQILLTMAQNNPQVRQAMQMLNGKSPDQLRQIATNMAAERGTTIETVARQLGLQLPNNQ